MIYVLSGGTKLFAAIGVTYPAGSTCTCTNGSKTLKAKNTSGQCVFAIPEAGTWIVTATNGTNTKSQNVEITSEGQSVSVKLVYTCFLFDKGDQFTDTTGGWKAYGANAYFVSGDGYLGVKAQSSNNDYPGIGGTVNPIDLTNFKTLKGMACRRLETTDVALIGVAKTQTNAASGFVASAKPAYSSSGAFLDFTLDISGLSGPHYIALASSAAGGSYYWVQAEQLWLE